MEPFAILQVHAYEGAREMINGDQVSMPMTHSVDLPLGSHCQPIINMMVLTASRLQIVFTFSLKLVIVYS